MLMRERCAADTSLSESSCSLDEDLKGGWLFDEDPKGGWLFDEDAKGGWL